MSAVQLLGDVFDFLPKSGLKASVGQIKGEYPFFSSSQDQSKWIDAPYYNADALVFGTGGDASVHHVNGPFSTSSDCLVATVKANNDIARFYYHYLRKNIQVLQAGFHGAGLKHISKSYLVAIPLPLVSEPEQRSITAILDKADIIRRKRREAHSIADELIRSALIRLLEESPDSRKPIGTLLPATPNAIRTGPFGSQLLHSEFTQSGIPVLGIDNAVTNRFQWDERRYITYEKYQELNRYKVFPGDVMITIMGTTGRVCIAPKNIPECISTKHLCTITPDPNRLLPEYLWASLLWDSSVREQAAREGKGAIMEGWNMGIVRGLLIKLPSLAQQERFVSLVKNVEMLRSKLDDGVRESDELFDSLGQKAFRGYL